MRKIFLEQGTDEWLQWRKGLLTATDAAILLGKHPYVTPFEGWQRKLGLIPEKTKTQAMERGHRDEPIARELFIKEYGINMTPCCVESDEYNFMGASLDGLSDCENYILEIKSQRPVKKIPEYHMIQMQHQMLSTDKRVKKAFYVSHWEGENITFEVDADENWIKEYIPKASEYWRRILFNDPPESKEIRYRDMSASLEWWDLADKHKSKDLIIKELEKEKAEIKKKLVELSQNESCSGGGIKLIKKFTRGRVDYNKLLESLDVPDEMIEKCREEGSDSWTITLDK